MDSGAPISYAVLESGTLVYSADGEQIGKVVHVLAAPEEDIFDGIVIDEPATTRGHRFVDADDVAALHERAVTLKLDAAACLELPRPSANPVAMRVDPADPRPSTLEAKLRRAWDLVSGNY